MSGKLDQSLDEIVSSHRRTGAPRRGRRVHVPRGGAKAVVAPVGGVKKSTKVVGKGATKGVPTGPAHGSGDSRVLVSGLPKDVSEQQIKDYFSGTVGPVKRVDISYGASGVSRGNATIIFVRSESASKAIKVANGIQIDGKPIKVDVILDAIRAAAIPPPKGLSERVTASKAQPKSAANTKTAAVTNGRGGKGKQRGGRPARSARPAKKTAEQLDSEMADYWQSGAAAEGDGVVTGGAAPPTNGDAAMEDEIL